MGRKDPDRAGETRPQTKLISAQGRNIRRILYALIFLWAVLMMLLAFPGFGEDPPSPDVPTESVKETSGEKAKTAPVPKSPSGLEAGTSGAAPASSAPKPPVLPAVPSKEHFHWGPALAQTFLFTSIMHLKRLGDPDTGPELRGVLFPDYIHSLEGLHGWDDHDPFMVQYVGHSFHGATDSRIELQNNPNGRAIDWGDRGYWHSRLVAMGWSALWGAQFKIGLYSEAMIGNVGLPNQYRKKPLPPDTHCGIMAWSEFFVNPVLGTTWVVSEDLVDRYAIRKMEGRTNRYFMYVARSFLTPSRTWANLLRFKYPWYRETRDIYGRPVTPR